MKILAVVCLATVLVAGAAAAAAGAGAGPAAGAGGSREAALRRAQEEEEQNAHAHYAFQADVDDRVSDLTLHRQEQRDGLAVTGSFAYSDGYVRRLVKYVADENGYRVLSDEAEPLEGPKGDPEGVASVRTVLEGQELSYSVQNDPRAAPPRPTPRAKTT